MPDIPQSAIRHMLDKQELLELVTRYCRAVDRADGELFMSCYHPDAYDDHGVFKGSPAGLLEKLSLKLGTMDPQVGPVQHSISNSLFEVDGDIAYGETYFHRRSVTPEGRLAWSMGRYVDRFERREGVWRIAHRRVILEDPRPGSNVADFVQGCRDKRDPSYDRVKA